MKKWADITSDSRWASADSTKRESVRRNYFDVSVAPAMMNKYEGDVAEVDRVRELFLNDTKADVMKGLAQKPDFSTPDDYGEPIISVGKDGVASKQKPKPEATFTGELGKSLVRAPNESRRAAGNALQMYAANWKSKEREKLENEKQQLMVKTEDMSILETIKYEANQLEKDNKYFRGNRKEKDARIAEIDQQLQQLSDTAFPGTEKGKEIVGKAEAYRLANPQQEQYSPTQEVEMPTPQVMSGIDPDVPRNLQKPPREGTYDTLYKETYKADQPRPFEYSDLIKPWKIGQLGGAAITTGVPAMALTVVTTAVTKNPALGMAAGGLYMYGIEGGSAYEEMKNLGLSDEEAASIGNTIGIINAIIEQANVMPLLKSMGLTTKAARKGFEKQITEELLRRAKLGHIPKDIGIQAYIEGMEEFFQELTNVYNTPEKDRPKVDELWKRLAESTVGGVIGGVGFGAVGGTVGTARAINELDNPKMITPTQEQWDYLRQNVSPKVQYAEEVQVGEERSNTDATGAVVEPPQEAVTQVPKAEVATEAVPKSEDVGVKPEVKRAEDTEEATVAEDVADVAEDQVVADEAGTADVLTTVETEEARKERFFEDLPTGDDYFSERGREYFDAIKEGREELRIKAGSKGGFKVSGDDSESSYIVTMTKENGKRQWRITYLTNDEPTGHDVRDTREEVIKLIPNWLLPGYRVDIPEELVMGIKGKEFKHIYQLTLRPFGIGTVPDGHTEYRDVGKFGQVVYDKPLSNKQIKHFDLKPIGFENAKPTPTESQPVSGVKEPWQMTRDEFGKSVGVSEKESFGIAETQSAVAEPNSTTAKLSFGEEVVVGKKDNFHTYTNPKSGKVFKFDVVRTKSPDGRMRFIANYGGSDQVAAGIVIDSDGRAITAKAHETGTGLIQSLLREAKQDFGKIIPQKPISKQGLRALHRSEIQQALSEGKPVPPEVLKDYPDLKPEAKPAEGV
jgi:hypothetical protein